MKPISLFRSASSSTRALREDVIAGEPYRARGGPVERAQDVEERRLAGAGLAEDRGALARGEIEVDAAQHLEHDAGLVVVLREPAHLDRFRRHHSYRSPSTGSIRAASVAGYTVARNEMRIAATMTESTVLGSTTTGSESR